MLASAETFGGLKTRGAFGFPLHGSKRAQCQRMKPGAQFVREQTIERCADDQHLKVRLGSFWNAVIMALVLNQQMRDFEAFGELVLNSFLASYRASLPRSSDMRETQRNVHVGSTVSFPSRAIQRRP